MEKKVVNATDTNTAAFFSLISNPLKFRLYLLKNLPAGYFSGLKIKEATTSSCTVSIPYKWFTRNPFRSTYFACLSMAAELSTGVLAMANLYKKKPAVSMLVTGIEGRFYKKATGVTFFQCNYGDHITEAVDTCIALRVAKEIKAQSIGRNAKGEVIAEFWVTWSFKCK